MTISCRRRTSSARRASGRRQAVAVIAAVAFFILAVPLAIAGFVHAAAGHDEAQNLDVQVFYVPQRRFQQLLLAVAAADHHDHAVHQLGDHQTVRHGGHRRQIQKDEVVVGAQLPQQRLHPCGGQQLRGVGRDVAGGDGLQVVQQVAGLHRVLHGTQTRQQIGKTGPLGYVEPLGQRGQAHIAIDQQHAVARLGHGIGQIDGQRALALVAQGAGDAHHAALSLIRQGEHQVGAQQLIRLGSGKAQVFADDRLLGLGGFTLARVPRTPLLVQAHRAASFPPQADALP